MIRPARDMRRVLWWSRRCHSFWGYTRWHKIPTDGHGHTTCQSYVINTHVNRYKILWPHNDHIVVIVGVDTLMSIAWPLKNVARTTLADHLQSATKSSPLEFLSTSQERLRILIQNLTHLFSDFCANCVVLRQRRKFKLSSRNITLYYSIAMPTSKYFKQCS